MKKVLLMLIFLSCLLLFGCMPQQASNNSKTLSQYKEEIKNDITIYYESLDSNDYSEDNWDLLKDIYNGSNDLIDNQNSKEDLFTQKNRILCKMKSISPKNITNDYILKSFDLEDKKVYWKGTVDDDFPDDLVIVVLKKPINYIELSVECFGLENAVSIEYVGGVTPRDYYFKPEYEYQLEHYRQIIFIHLEPLGKEKVIEVVRALEQLEFVKYASPNLAYEPT